MTAQDEAPHVLAIVGPTASGKSDMAIILAEELGGEVVSADAMQVYQGMDIGTAKVPVGGRRGIPHHLIDILDPVEESSAADIQRRGRLAIDEIRSAGRVPIVAGGSGLYISALLDDLEFGGTDRQIRSRLEDDLAAMGPEELHAQLSRIDPAAAGAILPSNGRRIVRALEYIEVTGEPYRARFAPAPAYPSVRVGLVVPWDALDQRIDTRVRRMWSDGMVAEVQRLLEAGLGRTAAGAIGYAQAIAQLRGELTEEQAMEETAVATRRLARRQMRWMRRDSRVVWRAYDDPGLLAEVVHLYRTAVRTP